MTVSANGVLVGVVIGLISYLIVRWWRDPLRKIPGPTPLPLFGNIMAIDPSRMHMQMYELAKKYGPVMKFSVFHKQVVVLNSLEVCLEAKMKRGTDFLGRPYFPRRRYVIKTDMGNMSYDGTVYPVLRRVATSGLRGYGPGIAQLEKIIQEVLQDMVEDLAVKAGQAISSHKICNSYVSSVIVYVLYGDRDSFDDSIFQLTHHMNHRLLKCFSLAVNDPILDVFPIFFKLMPFFFNKTYKFLEGTKEIIDKQVLSRIREAKESYDENDLRGCLDFFIKSQKEELDSNGQPLIDDDGLVGLMMNFIAAGMETSFESLSHSFLDLLHDKDLVKRIQAQIDANFAPTELIKHSDRERLPLLDAYIHENLRMLSQAPMLLPCSTLRDTEVGGYKIPRGTQVLLNGFNTAHNPDVYPDPFECKPDRFLDGEGNIVPPGHPVRHNFIGFGLSTRHCPGEALARTRIFMFLANILRKFDIEPAGELPDRDVRNYKMTLLIHPPPVDVKFTLRRGIA